MAAVTVVITVAIIARTMVMPQASAQLPSRAAAIGTGAAYNNYYASSPYNNSYGLYNNAGYGNGYYDDHGRYWSSYYNQDYWNAFQ